jgi:hypothetical protein
MVLLIELVEVQDLVQVLFHLTNHAGDEWRFYLLSLHLLPAYVCKEPVLFDLLYSFKAQPLAAIFC